MRRAHGFLILDDLIADYWLYLGLPVDLGNREDIAFFPVDIHVNKASSFTHLISFMVWLHVHITSRSIPS